MEKVLQHRVNHGDIWDSIKTVLTLGVSDLISGEAKESRTKIEKRDFEVLLQGLIGFYENPTTDKIKVYPSDGGWIELDRKTFLSTKNLPASMIDLNATPVKPMYASYLWAQVEDTVLFRGLTPEQAENRTGNLIKFQPVEFGKMDWSTILKQAGVMVAAIVGTVATGGIAAPAAVGAVKTVFDIQKQADAINKQTTVLTPTVLGAAQKAAEGATGTGVNTSGNKLASFMSFNNPYFIMGSMAVATVILFFLFKHKNK